MSNRELLLFAAAVQVAGPPEREESAAPWRELLQPFSPVAGLRSLFPPCPVQPIYSGHRSKTAIICVDRVVGLHCAAAQLNISGGAWALSFCAPIQAQLFCYVLTVFNGGTVREWLVRE